MHPAFCGDIYSLRTVREKMFKKFCKALSKYLKEWYNIQNQF